MWQNHCTHEKNHRPQRRHAYHSGESIYSHRKFEHAARTRETSAHYMLYVDKVNNLDTLELQVELDETKMVDTIRELQMLSRK